MQDVRQPRFAWIDIAKGICIILVVLGHTVDWYMRNFTGNVPIALTHFAGWLQPLRMPLFFGVSGILASRKVRLSLNRLWSKTAGLYFLYCLWTGLYCLKLLIPSARSGLPYPGWDQLALAFLLPVYVWYIWALPVFYMIASGLERIPGGKGIYAIIPMALLAMASGSVERAVGPIVHPPFDAVHVQNVIYNLLWFYLGLKGRDIWIGVVARSEWGKLWIAVFGYILTFAIASRLHMPEGLSLVCSALALMAALQTLGLINPCASIGRMFGFVGRNTLPVYVMHTMLLTALTFVIQNFGLQNKFDYIQIPLQLGIPIVISVLVTFLCIFIAKSVSRTPLKFAFEPLPSPFQKSQQLLPSTFAAP